jgi:hypothetical protein
MGKANYGEDGKIKAGTVHTNCTKPAKRYAKGIDVKVKGGIDSLNALPFNEFSLGVSKTVTRLADYSSEGLDIDLILFRLCEISLNKGFTADQTNALFSIAMDSWSKKNSSK